MKHSILLCSALLLLVAARPVAQPQPAPTTTITVSNTVSVPAVKRFGIQMSDHLYYDRVVLKNLVWRNAGFEALQYQTVIRCAAGTATGCLDDNPFTQWPTGFMNGASYEFTLGAAKGRTGTVESFVTAPRDGITGSTYTFTDSGVTPATGDYFVVKKYFPGGADTGWNPVVTNGATITSEASDLPPGTDGRQCIRLTAGNGQAASITTAFGAFANQTFVVMNGSYRLTFKAKGTGGGNSIVATVARGTNRFSNRSIPLTSSWTTQTIDFSASETGLPFGFVTVNFTASGSSALLDDVSLEQTNGDASNTTAFRDPVIAALRTYNPGMIRSPNKEQGESLDNLIGPPFGHVRAGYTVYGTSTGIQQYGWHEFLELCEFLQAEPYLDIPLTFSNAEMVNLMEYLGGPVTTPYGARRAARGHPAPWTDSFQRIHLEYGNEAWNPVFRGSTMFAADFGARGNEAFGVVRQSPYFSAKFNLILGVHTANSFNTRLTHNASANHDMLAIGPYIGSQINDFESNERLFGGLFAEASWWSVSSQGFVKQTADVVNATSRPVPLIVYEVNLHTTEGSISQPVLDAFAPSMGAGLAVADHMLMMLREFKIREQALFALGGHRYDRADGKTVLLWSVTRDMGVTDRKRPQYLALQLVNEALAGGGDMVQTSHTGDDPRWNQPLTNRIALNNVPYIQSFAFVNGSRKGVVVFNLHRTSELTVNFSGPHAPSGAVRMRRLTSNAITDTNEDAENVSIQTSSFPSFDPSQPLALPPFSMTVLLAGDTATTAPAPSPSPAPAPSPSPLPSPTPAPAPAPAPTPAPALPVMSPDRTSLSFSAVNTGSAFTARTPAQTVRIRQSGAGAVTWTASSGQPWLTVSPSSGSGPSVLTIGVQPGTGLPAAGSVTGAITITYSGSSSPPSTVSIRLALVTSSAAPFGAFDTPAGDATVLAGSVAVTGWTLDDLGVQRVELWRDLQAGETTPPFASSPADQRHGKVFVANATFVDGARPDVETLNPTFPLAYRAGWGYLLLTWGLWNQGNGTYTLHAYAVDEETNMTPIGTKTIVVSNNTATRPFGSIDTPAIGGDASGPNFGWGLTPKVNNAATCKIPSNGVQVSIDSGPLQPVVFGADARTDIAEAFADFSNSTAAGGHFVFDWTTLTSGTHTIGWLITDDCNRSDGVGSRFFNVPAGTSPVASAGGSRAQTRSDAEFRLKAEATEPDPVVSAFRRNSAAEEVSAFGRNDDGGPVLVSRGYGELPKLVTPDNAGSRTIEITQGERIEIRVSRGFESAYQLVSGQMRPLPIGSTWDAGNGIFYWQPAPGFLGRYRIVFNNGRERINVRVVVVPV